MKPFNTAFKYAIASFLILFLAAPLLLGRTLPQTKPEMVGVSSEKLEQIQTIAEDYIKQNKIAGTVVLMARHGKIFYHRSFGRADEGKPMQPDAIFRICSMSKAITSVAVMMLYEEKKLKLDDRLSKYIPEFGRPKVVVRNRGKDRKKKPYFLEKARRPILIRHLLTHTSGLSYRFWGKNFVGKLYVEAGISDGLTQTEGTLEDMMKKLGKLPLLFHPGEKWEYGLSNDVLGRVVEVVSGMPFDQYLEEKLFKPLGMKDTFFFVPKDKANRLVAIYKPTADGKLRKMGVDPETPNKYLVHSASAHTSGPKTYFSGGGGLASTAYDYALFLQMLLNGGELNGIRFLNKKSITSMTTNQIGPLKNFIGGFKWGFGVAPIDGPTGSLYVWGGHFYTSFWVDPDRDILGVVMTQRYPAIDHNNKIWGVVSQSITGN